MGAYELNLPVLNIHMCYSILVYVDVSKIANHALFIIRCAVITPEGVENATCRNESLGEITEDVDVKTVFARKKTSDGTVDRCGCLLLSL